MNLAINNVTNLCNFVGKVVCVCVCLELLSHFLAFKIHLTNISPILIKMADFKTLAWATSFATRASRRFIYLPYRASGKKSYCHTLVWKWNSPRWDPQVQQVLIPGLYWSFQPFVPEDMRWPCGASNGTSPSTSESNITRLCKSFLSLLIFLLVVTV